MRSAVVNDRSAATDESPPGGKRYTPGVRVLLAVLLATLACGGTPPVPKNGVIEGNLGDDWIYKRNQSLRDIEVFVPNNPGTAFTASYVLGSAQKTGRIQNSDIVSAFVTRYEKDDGIVRETVRFARRLAAEKGYRVDETKIAGTRALSISGSDETWVMWPAKGHVVKVGGVGRSDVPESVVEDYADRYPSLLPGGALEGALPPGEDEKPVVEEKPAYDPNAPKPDIDKYDPKKVKIPEKKVP